MISESTPVLYVEVIAPSLAFFEALGFVKTVDVPEVPDDPSTPLGFCILECGAQKLMLQTYQSGINDMPSLDPAHFKSAHSFLFLKTDNLSAAEAALADHVQLFPRRNTFYGAEETGWREPGGHIIVVAHFAAE
jgi:hypothetical protein